MIESSLPRILIIAEMEDLNEEANLPQLLLDLGSDRYRWECWTVMDAFMKELPDGLAAAILDLGLFNPLHQDLLDKLVGEVGLPVLVHLTDDRPETIRLLGGHQRVRRLKKPCSLHEVLNVLDELVGEPGGPEAAG